MFNGGHNLPFLDWNRVNLSVKNLVAPPVPASLISNKREALGEKLTRLINVALQSIFNFTCFLQKRFEQTWLCQNPVSEASGILHKHFCQTAASSTCAWHWSSIYPHEFYGIGEFFSRQITMCGARLSHLTSFHFEANFFELNLIFDVRDIEAWVLWNRWVLKLQEN